MVKKFFNLISREINGLHQAAYLLAAFALLSQILGLARDRLLASSFGAGQTLDLYYAAFRIPDFLYITIGSMVSVSVLIPFLINKMKDGPDEGKKFIGHIFLFFFLLIVGACSITFIFVPEISKILFPGFDAAALNTVNDLTRVLLLSPIFLGLSNILGTLTQAHKRFFLYALSPILYNLSIIFGILFLFPKFGITGLVYGVIIGAFLHFSIQLPFIIGEKLLPKPQDIRFNFREIKSVLSISIPRTLTLGSDNISFIFLVSLASLMTAGSISVFNFSYNLETVPLSMIGISYSLAVFPILTKYFSLGEIEKFRNEIILSAKHVIFWSLPFSTLFVVLRTQIVQTILGTGRFSSVDIELTAMSLAIFSLSIVCQNLTLLFVRAYYAAGNTRKPFIAKFVNALATIILGYGFMVMYSRLPLWRSILGNVILALPLGWSIGELFNTVSLWIAFDKDFKRFTGPVMETLSQVILSSLIMGLTSYYSLNVANNIIDTSTGLGTFFQGAIAGVAGMFTGILTLYLVKNKELTEIWETAKNKFTIKINPPPEHSGLISQ